MYEELIYQDSINCVLCTRSCHADDSAHGCEPKIYFAQVFIHPHFTKNPNLKGLWPSLHIFSNIQISYNTCVCPLLKEQKVS